MINPNATSDDYVLDGKRWIASVLWERERERESTLDSKQVYKVKKENGIPLPHSLQLLCLQLSGGQP